MTRRSRARRALVTPPSEAVLEPQTQWIIVMFVDIVGCSEISNNMNLRQYNEFLDQFHRLFDNVCAAAFDSYAQDGLDKKYYKYDSRGDEGVLMIFFPNRKDDQLADDVDTSIQIALELKRRWLLTDHNRDRIGDGLLPTDLGIGIHIGKAFINQDADDELRPEGYAINLGKRIESESRLGRFTHILLSETAREQLDDLTDEITYTFTDHHAFQAKGISRDISVCELKHHFLPTDWADEDPARSGADIAGIQVSEEEMQVFRKAQSQNPTNLWLAEEFIMLSMVRDYDRLKEGGQEGDRAALEAAFADAERVSRRLIMGDHRDPGTLTIRGFVLGERYDFAAEQKLYRDATDMDANYPEAHWYMALSLSHEVNSLVQPDDTYDSLPDELQAKVDEAIRELRRATELGPRKAWGHYDLACELCRWAHQPEAVELLNKAISLKPSIRRFIQTEFYLNDIKQLFPP